MSSTSIGRSGEAMTALELQKLGYSIIEQNWRTTFCEIDIIAKNDDVVLMVEVKYRSRSDTGDGLEAITPKKLTQMKRAAEAWVAMHNYKGDYQCAAAAVDSYGAVEIVLIDE